LDADGTTKKKAEKDKKSKKDSGRARWAVQVFCISVVLSGALSFASGEVLEGAGLALAFAVLAAFIVLGIVFDIIGVAVTAADEKPFHSMAAHRTPGAKEALGLIRQASKVSSFCNDVVGDICGIISGSTAAVIVVRLQSAFSLRSALISLAVTALVSGLTIGGKAMGKAFAIDKSTAVLQLVGRALHLFSGKKK
jgi:CBS domain containing-hemolysin-like protein